MIKVGVVGFGAIGQRIAEKVLVQKDMELVGVADTSYSLAVQALVEKGMPFAFYSVLHENDETFTKHNIPLSGTLADLVSVVDIIVDASTAGMGEQNKIFYERSKKHALFQSGEDNSIAQCYFHSYINYDKARGKQFLQMPPPSLIAMLRVIDSIDRSVRIERLNTTIFHRYSKTGYYEKGLTNALKIEPGASLHAKKIMEFIPHIQAMSILVQVPTTHGHLVTLHAGTTKPISKDELCELFANDRRMRVVTTEQGFHGDASLFRFARDCGVQRGDLHPVAIWEDSIQCIGNDVFLALGVLPEGCSIPETIDAIRASCSMQKNHRDAIARTNEYLRLAK